MKKSFLLLLAIPFIGFAQASMELRNTANGTTISIADNTKIKAVANGHTFRGKMHLSNAQSLYIRKSLVRLEDITSIRTNSTAKAVAGGIATTTGLLTGGTAIDKSQKAHSRSDWTYRIIM